MMPIDAVSPMTHCDSDLCGLECWLPNELSEVRNSSCLSDSSDSGNLRGGGIVVNQLATNWEVRCQRAVIRGKTLTKRR